MLTLQNTDGYTQEQIDKLNNELADRLTAVGPDELDQLDFIEKSFADEVARRND